MYARVGLAVLSLAGLCGCNPATGLQPVTGTVTFEGRPLDQGAIQFFPIDGGSVESGAGITNGQYTIPAANGLPPGKYKVTVLSYDQTGAKVPDPSLPPGEGSATIFKERIPLKYNAETILTAEVVAGKPNKFDFALEGEPQ